MPLPGPRRSLHSRSAAVQPPASALSRLLRHSRATSVSFAGAGGYQAFYSTSESVTPGGTSDLAVADFVAGALNGRLVWSATLTREIPNVSCASIYPIAGTCASQ